MKSLNNISKNGQNKRQKGGSVDKKLQKKITDIKSNNFWDIETGEGESNFTNIPSKENNKIKLNSFINKNNNIENEKSNNITLYSQYKYLLNKDNQDKYTMNNNKNKNKKANNSVDNIRIKNKKNFDKLSVFERNKKWLENKKEKLNKELQKYIKKQNKEILENNIDYTKTKKKPKNIDNIFNEEDSVTLKQENINFFMRLMQGRKEREKSFDHNHAYAKINCLKKSHYSGRQTGNITHREMKKYIKFIHKELKDSNFQY